MAHSQEMAMAEDVESIKSALREFILQKFLPGEDPAALDDETPLITGGVLDSIATIQYASFVEDRYGIELPNDILTAEGIDTLAKMAAIVQEKTRS
jgi:acyl carrier protein